MKKIIFGFLASIITLSFITHTMADDIKIGVILGFTGPIESLTPTMASSAEMAMKEASDSGLLLNGALERE